MSVKEKKTSKILMILSLRKSGYTYKDIENLIGITRERVSWIVRKFQENQEKPPKD